MAKSLCYQHGFHGARSDKAYPPNLPWVRALLLLAHQIWRLRKIAVELLLYLPLTGVLISLHRTTRLEEKEHVLNPVFRPKKFVFQQRKTALT